MSAASRKRGAPASDDGADSSQSATKSLKTKDSASAASSNKYALSHFPAPPRYPFVNGWFPLQLLFTDIKKNFKRDWCIPITVDLLYDTGDAVANQSMLEINSATPLRFNGEGALNLSVRLTQVSMKHENRSFQLRFSVAKSPAPYIIDSGESLTQAQLNNLYSVQPVLTEPMTVIKHKLKIIEQPPSNWYKDEGGRDKCMSVKAQLVDESDRVVSGREVPLKVTLCYDSSIINDTNNKSTATATAPSPSHADADSQVEVKNQNILRFGEGSVNRIDGSGKVEIKVRVEEVSKNHQKQAFVLKIGPDVLFSPANADVAPVYTSPITVLSKRNKRRKKENNGFTPLMIGSSSLSATNLTSPMSTLAHEASSSLAPPQSQSKSLNLPIDFRPSPALTQTFQSISSWCQYVVRGLASLEWQHVGFEITENGEIHLQRPLHRCPSCWTYKDAIRPTNHHERCMLMIAKQRYYSEIQNYLTQLQSLATGQTSAASIAASSHTSGGSDGKKRGSNHSDEMSDSDHSGDSDDDSEGDEPVTDPLANIDKGNLSAFDVLTQSNTNISANTAIVDPNGDALPSNDPSLFASFSQSLSFLNPLNPTFIKASSFDMPAVPSAMECAIPAPPSVPQSQSTMPVPRYGNEEQHVSSIFITNSECGLPAFSADERLMGFYIDEETRGITFYPTASFASSPHYYPRFEPLCQSLLSQYKTALNNMTGEVLLRRDYSTLERLKEEAILLLYTRETQRNNQPITIQ